MNVPAATKASSQRLVRSATNDADGGCAGQRRDCKSHERRVADACLERPSVQLVESVGRDAHAEKERQQSEAEHHGLEVGASAAPIATYERCQSVYGGCSNVT